MMISDRSAPLSQAAAKDDLARLLGEFEKAILRGDPIAVYQAILLCSDKQIVLPEWLTNHLLQVIADYHRGVKPSWKGAGKRPLIIIRRRFENQVRRRAVNAVRAWINDRTKYQDLPTECIRAWSDQEYRHSEMQTDGDALEFTSYGLQGIRLQDEGPLLKCSTRTLRRAMEDKNAKDLPALPGRIAEVFGLTDPDSLFGTDLPLKTGLK